MVFRCSRWPVATRALADGVPHLTDSSRTPSRTGLRQSVGAALIAAVVSSAALFGGLSSNAFGQADPLAGQQASHKLINQADLFMHYSLMGNQTLAHDFGAAVLQAGPTPVQTLRAFERAANGRHIMEIILADEQNPKLKSVAMKLGKLINQGYIALARDPFRIRQAILAMGKSPQAYVVSRSRLRAAGEFAGPYFFHFLGRPADKDMQPYLVQMMSDLGKPLVNPLVQELQVTPVAEKVQIIQVLGNIGYPQAMAYIKQLLESPSSPIAVKDAARAALAKLDPTGQFASMTPAQLYMRLAWSYFHNEPSVSPNQPDEATNPVWYFDPALQNVTGVEVPTPIWKDIQTMRACEAALQLDPHNSQAISLWITANLRREVNLPSGQIDPTRKAGAPDAGYYAVAAGPRYLNSALTYALQEENSALIVKVIAALAQTGGVQGLVGSGRHTTPLLDAMTYPDPLVRFAAASALAKANPAATFNGAYRVVPVLSEAIAQSSKPTLLLVNPSNQIRNQVKGELRAQFHVIDGSTVAQAMNQARDVPYLGLVIVPGGVQANQLISLAATDDRLRYTPVLVTGSASELTKAHLDYVQFRTFGVVPNGAGEQTIISRYHAILKRLGSMTPSSGQAMRLSIAAAGLLKSMAQNRASIFNVNVALPALNQALHNQHNRVVVAAAAVLGYVRNPKAQLMLARASLNSSSAPAAVQQRLFNDLATSARNVGNHLNSAQVNSLIQVVATESDPKVQIAAAAALGALNVPSNQASKLIRGQIR